MKKILNQPQHYVDEMLDGFCLAHSEYYQQPLPRVISRAQPGKKGKVGIVSGGGSGHLPLFTGYVGKGLLDAAAIGNVFASPSSEQMVQAIKEAHQGAGILLLYGNYGGDVMNFDMASETVGFEDDIACKTVLLADDVASAAPEEHHKRRGVAGMIYAYKIAGAKAEQMASLDEVARVAQKAADVVRSIGCALTPCTVPSAGKPTFTLADDEMEMGMGIHGEPGIWRDKLCAADDIADEMLKRLLTDMPLKSGDEVSVLVNSLGATPPEELYILYRRIYQQLKTQNITVVMPLVGRYATSMEMTGATLTLCKLDDELKSLLLEPAECAYWRV